ncbi:MAG: 30S ribosomal protein S6 [Holosporales bacterium]|jgi:small subunit ribosomal protein S6|nr:30S ribosomal protein S6 [Holosporales bacterium]
MRLYENIFIVRQDLAQSQVEGIAENVANLIKKGSGEVVRSEYCGMRSYAYPIKKSRKGHYFYLQIKTPQDAMRETECYMKLNEEILRFLTVSVDKFDTGACPLVQQKKETSEAVNDAGRQEKPTENSDSAK